MAHKLVNRLWSILWVPLAILLLVAVAILLAAAIYLRVLFTLIRLPWDWLRGVKPEPPKPPYQEPHVITAKVQRPTAQE